MTVHNIRAEPITSQNVYIGRATNTPDILPKPMRHTGYFGNPFRLPNNAARDQTLDRFEAWARERGGIQPDGTIRDPVYRKRVKLIADKHKFCFCAPAPCHGHVLETLGFEWRAEDQEA